MGSRHRPKPKKRLSQRFNEKTLASKFLLIGSLSGALMSVGALIAYGSGLVETYRPYAIRETERVVADIQRAQYGTDLRDIQARIIRLENQRKLYPQRWTQQDEAELRYWYAQQAEYMRRLEYLKQQQRPQYYGPR